MVQNKSKLALAVLSVLAVPGLMFSQSATAADKDMKAVVSGVELQMYGKLYPELVNVRHSGATAGGVSESTLGGSSTVAATAGVNPKNFTALATTNSAVGIRAEKTLGSGLTGRAQIEYGVNFENKDVNIGARNSFVEIEGGFGAVKVGLFDTVFKDNTDTLSFLGVSSGNIVSNSTLTTKAGFAKKDKKISSSNSFNLRQPNSIGYESPTFGGAKFLIQYALAEDAETPTLNPNLWSTALTYQNKGGLELALAHEIHNDFFGGSKNTSQGNDATVGAHSRDTATRATAGYKFGNTKVQLNLINYKLSESGPLAAGKFESYKKNAYTLNVQQKFGKLTAQASYANSAAGSCSLVGGVACTTQGLEANQLNLGVMYDLPELSLFALYSRINNGASAKFDTRENDSVALEPGTDLNQLAVGVMFRF